jgi:hypothetical protein
VEVAAASLGAIRVSVFHFECMQLGEQREQVGVCVGVVVYVCVGGVCVWVYVSV